jgi:hypothetical protein
VSSHLLHAKSVNEFYERGGAFNGQLVEIPEIFFAPEARNESRSCSWSRTLHLFVTFFFCIEKRKLIDCKHFLPVERAVYLMKKTMNVKHHRRSVRSEHV